jgi:hypothetical protein
MQIFEPITARLDAVPRRFGTKTFDSATQGTGGIGGDDRLLQAAEGNGWIKFCNSGFATRHSEEFFLRRQDN